jgi:hypothetical protein
VTKDNGLIVFDADRELADPGEFEDIETSTDRLNEINRHCRDEFLNATDSKERERTFRMYMVTHTVLAADEGASDEALVRNFLLSKPGLMSLLKDDKNMRRVYDAFENHISLHSAHHLLLSPEGFVACLRRIAHKANKALSHHTGVSKYLHKKK